VLAELDLGDLFGDVGPVLVVGSYLSGLMYWRDLDVCLLAGTDEASSLVLRSTRDSSEGEQCALPGRWKGGAFQPPCHDQETTEPETTGVSAGHQGWVEVRGFEPPTSSVRGIFR
jgi:hypothetical protein